VVRDEELPSAIQRIDRRISEIQDLNPRSESDLATMAETIATKVSQTMADIYGAGTVEAEKGRVSPIQFGLAFAPADFSDRLEHFVETRDRLIARLSATRDGFEERLQSAPASLTVRALRAYQGLDLHPEIERASGDLYRDGHYANAIEDAVKALNDLVRMRSGASADGTALMEGAFSPKNPILAFNALADQSDFDEQKGFMMLFSGAVAGLRNPRAHKLIQDDPERALEFIAFVSLLAKLLDGAKNAADNTN
jgi:uncharacterized protein (TIGR02391 family)